MDNTVKDNTVEDNAVEENADTVITAPKSENRLAEALMVDEASYLEETPFEQLTIRLATKPPGYPAAQALQALEEGDAEESLSICDSLIAKSDGSSLPLSVYLVRGRALLTLKRADEAAEEFHRLLRNDPECPAALKGLGDTYFVQDKEIIAFTYYERARELSGSFQALSEPVRYKTVSSEGIPPDNAPTESAPVQEITIETEPISTSTPEIIVTESTAVEKIPTGSVAGSNIGSDVDSQTIVTLEEIVVREDAGELRDENDVEQVESDAGKTDNKADEEIIATPVSLTIKRGSESKDSEVAEEQSATETNISEPEFAAVAPEERIAKTAENLTVKPTSLKSKLPKPKSPKPMSLKKPAPKELPERYDSIKRPAHYQTETMADTLLQQGHTIAAIEIYRILIEKNPLQRTQEKLAKAESRQKRSR